MLPLVLNFSQPLPDTWHVAYGITSKRHRTLLAALPNRNSFVHPSSETALSLFMFGNMDCWKQSSWANVARTITGDWSHTFFDGLRCGRETVGCTQSPLWAVLEQGVFSDERLSWQQSILLFEFEVMNSAFHSLNNKAFKNLSFIDIKSNKKWGAFDAFLIVPATQPTENFKGALIGIEAKLGSDISQHTKGFPFVNQVMRNLEAGYWLTHHDSSLYRHWQFHYAFVCPRQQFKLGATLYSWMLRDLASRDAAVTNYRSVLTYHGASVDDSQFESFRQAVRDRVVVLHWDIFAMALQQGRESYWNEYIGRVRSNPACGEVVGASLARLKAAGIRIQ